MIKGILRLLVTVGIIAGIGALVYFAMKTKRLQVNRWVVSDRDIIGVDLSEYQAEVDMPALMDQGIKFVYIKATEGSSHVDSRFEENWESAQECGLCAGAYHFFSFDSPGELQAQNYIDTVGDLKGKMIPAVDVEFYLDKKDNPPLKEDVVRQLGAFITALEEEYHVKPLIYSPRSIYEEYLEDDFGEYPRWIRSVYYPAVFEAQSDWVVWQYCDTAQLMGYTGGERRIDLNVLQKGISLEEMLIDQEHGCTND